MVNISLWLQFTRQSRFYLGTEELPPKQSALHPDIAADLGHHGSTNHQPSGEDTDAASDINTRDLPSKVDSFIEYINDVHLGGTMDSLDKAAFRAELGLKKGSEDGLDQGLNDSLLQPRRIYNGDDHRGATPVSRRMLVLED